MKRAMNRTAIAIVTGLTLAGSLIALPAAAQEGRRGDYPQEQNRDRNDRDDSERNRDDRGRDQDARRSHDTRADWRDDRRDARWDVSRHNGYYDNKGWHFGPPGDRAYGKKNFSLGYRPWRNGDRLGYYRTRYQVIDYRQQNLDRPRRGYHWVRDDYGVYLLASIASGLIIEVLNRNARW